MLPAGRRFSAANIGLNPDAPIEPAPRRKKGASNATPKWRSAEIFWFHRKDGKETGGGRKIIYFLAPTSQ